MDESQATKDKKARESRLQLAIANDDVDELHNLIVDERELLDRVCECPFPNTPLHRAAAAGKTLVAMEMAILKPSFARELNPEGYSPMHLALQHEHYHIVRALMALDPKLIRIRGRCGITPLHYVAKKEGDNELELLAEFLCTCKSSIEDLTSRCETAVHVAIKNHNLKAFKVLFGWLRRVQLTEILNWKDQDGNTVLHIAVSKRQRKVIKLLIGHIKLSAKNFQNKTALDIFQENSSCDQNLDIFQLNSSCDQNLAKKLRPPALKVSSLSQFLSRELTSYEWIIFIFGHRDERARDIILLVATLIATATYQAALSPPGGYWGDSSSNTPANSTVVAANSSSIAVEKPHQAGNIILNGSKLYAFTALNSLVFLVSIITIWITAIPLLPRTIPVYLLAYLVGNAYFLTLQIEFPKSADLAGACMMGIYLTLLGVVLVGPAFLWGKYGRLRWRLDAPGTRAGNFLEWKDQK